MKKIFSTLIILFIAFSTGHLAARIFDISSQYKTNNFETVAFHTRSCTPVASAESNQNIILRIDDIQKGFLVDIQEKMIMDAKNRGMKLVLGIIPENILDEVELIGMIRNNYCSLEIAQHGLTHSSNGNYEEPEFGNVSKEEAIKLMTEGKKKLKKITKKPISTFIPPQNVISDQARHAATEVGFEKISSEGTEQYDYDQSTFDWTDNKLNDVSEIMNGCQRAFAQDGTCIIMLHPQDYATAGKIDTKKYQKYLLLLESIKQEDIVTVTFQDI